MLAGGPKPSARPRMGGGINSGLGAANEHMDEAALQSAMQQKGLGQQGASPGSLPGALGSLGQGAGTSGKKKPPRSVAPLKEPGRILGDIAEGLASLFDINSIFNIDAGDTPEQQAKKQQLHQRFQSLTQDEQAFAQKKYQEEMQLKQKEEEEKQLQKQKEQQAKMQRRETPSSPKKGPMGPAAGKNKKKQASQQLQQQRQQMSGPSSIN